MNWKIDITAGFSFLTVRKASAILKAALTDVAPPETCGEVELAFVEACTNSVKHGNTGKPNERLAITIEFDGSEIRIEIEDHGGRFDPTGSQFRKIERDKLSKLPTKGMGLPLIRELVDAVRYIPERGRNRIILIKKVPPVSAPSKTESAESPQQIGQTEEKSGVPSGSRRS